MITLSFGYIMFIMIWYVGQNQYFLVLGEILSADELVTGLGIARVFHGIFTFTYPTVIGLIKDNIGFYSYSFSVVGLLHMLFSILFGMTIRCCRK